MGSFLRRLAGLLARSSDDRNGAQVYLGAFGKHPGWEDHIEDIGLDSPRLVAIKQGLYVRGLGGNNDSGAWEQLGKDERIDGFRHLFFEHLRGEVVVGRMWSSSDAQGRTRYPMVVCAHCSGLSMAWVLQEVLPRLEDAERRCVATRSASDVRTIVQETEKELRHLAEQVGEPPQKLLPSLCTLAELADHPELGPDHQGLHRILYHIGRKMPAYSSRGKGSKTTSVGSWRAEPMRLPRCADSAPDAAFLWLRFLLGEFDRAVPLLLVLPLDEPWVDVIVGETGSQQFYCVRAKQIPLTTDIPYSLEDEFIAKTEDEIESSRAQPAP